jgi:hypothetical protein
MSESITNWTIISKGYQNNIGKLRSEVVLTAFYYTETLKKFFRAIEGATEEEAISNTRQQAEITLTDEILELFAFWEEKEPGKQWDDKGHPII